MSEDEANDRDKSNECFEIIGDRSQLGPKEEKSTETNGNGKKEGESSKSKPIFYSKVDYEFD